MGSKTTALCDKLLVEVPAFSKYVFGSAVLRELEVQSTPSWLETTPNEFGQLADRSSSFLGMVTDLFRHVSNTLMMDWVKLRRPFVPFSVLLWRLRAEWLLWRALLW